MSDLPNHTETGETSTGPKDGSIIVNNRIIRWKTDGSDIIEVYLYTRDGEFIKQLL
jgi:hypothetical protein